MNMKPKTIALLVVGVLLVIILLQNTDETRIEILFWTIARMPLFVLILGTLLIGAGVGWFSHMAYQRGRHKHAAAPPEATKVEAKARDKSEPSESSAK